MKKERSRTRRTGQLLSVILSWDFFGAAVSAVALFAAWMLTGDLQGGRAYFLAGVPASLVITGLAWTQLNTLAQWLASGDGYGEIVRMSDPSEDRAYLPFRVVITVSLLSTVVCLVGAILVEGTDARTTLAVLHAAALFLFVWALLGFWSLLKIVNDHRRLRARVQRTREQAAVDGRQPRRSSPREAPN